MNPHLISFIEGIKVGLLILILWQLVKIERK